MIETKNDIQLAGERLLADEWQTTATPVVPAAIFYHDHGMVWGDESFLTNFYRQMGHWRTDVDFWIGEPITAESDAALMDAVKASIDLKLREFNI